MLYQKPDGTLVIDDRPAPPDLFAEERRAARETRNALFFDQLSKQVASVEQDESEITREVAEIDELTEYAEWAWECSMDESAAFGFIAIMDDFEELHDFALVDRCIHDLEADFDAGRVGGAEIAEYNELMGEFREMMGRECHV